MIINKLLKRNRCGWNWAWRVRDDVKRFEQDMGIELSKDELIKYLFGEFNEYPETSLDIYLMTPTEKTMMNRLNLFWVFPLTVIRAPFSYVINGYTGWCNKTTIGAFVLRCIGEDS